MATAKGEPGGGRRRLRGLGVRIIRVLDGETRVSNGWGWLTLGLPGALALYLFQLVEGQGPTPHHYALVWPAIFVCLAMALVGLFLLLAPTVRRFVVGRRGRSGPRPMASQNPHIRNTPRETPPTAADYAALEEMNQRTLEGVWRGVKSAAAFARWDNRRDEMSGGSPMMTEAERQAVDAKLYPGRTANKLIAENEAKRESEALAEIRGERRSGLDAGKLLGDPHYEEKRANYLNLLNEGQPLYDQVEENPSNTAESARLGWFADKFDREIGDKAMIALIDGRQLPDPRPRFVQSLDVSGVDGWRRCWRRLDWLREQLGEN